MRHILVCEADDNLIRRMHGEAIVVRTNNGDDVGHFARVINETNKIHCIEYITDDFVADIQIREDWKDVPIHVMSPAMGDFMGLIVLRPAMKDMPIRFFLDASDIVNYTDLQIMASLGVPGGLWFKGGEIPWSEFSDLMTYAVYPKVYRADIEPFASVLRNYRKDQISYFPVRNFNNPLRYLHVDKDENVALTAEKLEQGEFLFQGLSKLDEVTESKGYKEWKKQSQRPFMKITTCGSCPAWRICGGEFSYTIEKNPGCKKALEELVEAAELHAKQQEKTEKEVELCQL